MRRWSGFIAAVALALLLLSGSAGWGKSGGLRLKKVEIVDAQGFERPMTALTLLIPTDWQAQGGVRWNAAAICQTDGTRVEWTATGPGGFKAMEIIPAAAWQWNNASLGAGQPGGCPFLEVSSAREFLEFLVSQRRPGALVLDYRERPDLTAELKSYNQTTPMPMGDMQSLTEAGEALIGYSYQGRSIRESIQVIVFLNRTRMSAMYGGAPTEFLSGVSLPAFAMRAPDGELDFTLMNTVQRSMKLDPAWSQRINAHNRKISGIQAKGIADRAAITSKANAEISQIIRDGEEYRQSVMDKSHEKWSRVIREVEVYDDPLEGRVELPNTYERAWRLDDGSYWMSDDANFDPYRDLGLNGTELNRSE
ncbi:MAG: hypothetical protein U9R74_10640 [Pseudomonadota bacterium]|nr:hypothetical protein [Pseudomonadota bacterium]